MRSVLLALLLVSLAVLAAATSAGAHALVERSEPPAYRLLLKPPDRIVLYFSEPIDARRTAIRVLDQQGLRVDEQGFQLSPDRRQARLPVRLPGPGIYTVTWRTLSLVDQHTYEGFFTFTAGPLRPGAFTLQAGVPRGPTPWEVAARWLMFLGAAVLGGGFLIHRFLLPSVLNPKFLSPGHDWFAALNRRWRIAAWLGAAAFFSGSVGDVAAQAARAATAAGVSLGITLAQLATG
ncbi:MAG: copper resistance CopC family protein, partial [Candidatus Methylomirabilales bacterium]